MGYGSDGCARHKSESAEHPLHELPVHWVPDRVTTPGQWRPHTVIALIAAIVTSMAVSVGAVWGSRNYVDEVEQRLRTTVTADMRHHEETSHRNHLTRQEYDTSIGMILNRLGNIEAKIDRMVESAMRSTR